MRELDGISIIAPGDGADVSTSRSVARRLISAEQTSGRWELGEVIADPSEEVATHVHPGEAEALIILEGTIELHAARQVAHIGPGMIVFIPPNVEHGLRTPRGGRWIAVWPTRERAPGRRYVPNGC